MSRWLWSISIYVGGAVEGMNFFSEIVELYRQMGCHMHNVVDGPMVGTRRMKLRGLVDAKRTTVEGPNGK